ncbi:MAG: CehA/McbA family metallohydrolase [Bryobacteraceae bacterium]|nr:CehA/McbA family metallohydrolase [Bryobacteraceae bacterium]
MKRTIVLVTFAALLGVAIWKAPPVAGQGAVPPKQPGHENITFWVNHNGLEQLDVLGQVEFADMARILMRRRANTEKIRGLRATFTFPRQEMELLDTPDVFRLEIDGGKQTWRHRPERFVIGANLTFNLPLVVRNTGSAPAAVEARFTATTSESAFPPVTIGPGQAAGFFLRVVETNPGQVSGKLAVKTEMGEAASDAAFDVRPLARLKVKVSEPARFYLTGADGLAYAPPGSASRMTAMSAEYYFHSNEGFEMNLPAGATTIEATRGIEYELTSRTIDLKPGVVNEVELPLKRWTHMARRGWYSSDAHIHANYTAHHHQTITAGDIRLQTVGEDLNYANLMVANSSGAFLHDEQYFEGKPHRLSLPDHVMQWGEEMRNAGLYGHMCFYNLKSLVHPLYTGFRNTPQWEDYPPNYTQAKAARAQGGAVTYAHPTRNPVFESSSSAELPVDLALGEVDAMDVLANTDEMASMALWYRLLNSGLRLAISAGTDSFTNVADHYIPGGGRVYAYAGERFDAAAWVESYKRGRSFASNGPMITMKVNGKEAGEQLRLPAGAGRVTVDATIESALPVERVEIIVNGQVAASKPMTGQRQLLLKEDTSLPRSAWVAVRAIGPWHRMVLNDTQVFAHTSPVYVQLGTERIHSDADARFLRDWIEKLIAKVRKSGRFSDEAKRREVVALFERALEFYQVSR